MKVKEHAGFHDMDILTATHVENDNLIEREIIY